MNLTDMIAFVRLQADADTEDAPTENLTIYARAAYNDIRRRIHMWPSLRTSYTMSTSADQSDYPFTDFTDDDVEFIQTIVGQNDVVDFVPLHEMLLLQEGTGVAQTSLDATYYSVSNETLIFWPTPTGVREYTIRGLRRFAEWPDGSNVDPDLPREFDEAICWYMLAMYFAAQEDLELSQRYLADYERSVSRFVASSMRTSSLSGRPLIFGGRRRYGIGYESWVRRNVEGVVL